MRKRPPEKSTVFLRPTVFLRSHKPLRPFKLADSPLEGATSTNGLIIQKYARSSKYNAKRESTDFSQTEMLRS